MNDLQIFNNTEFGTIRAIEINGEPWFVGKDIAEALGYSNTRDAIAKHVDDEDLNTVAIRDGIGNPNTTVLNESGLYSLTLSSKLPTAKKFKRWITSEVLPSIRKHGMYAVDEVLANPDMLINALMALKEERNKNRELIDTVAVKDQQIAEMTPKVSYYNVILNTPDAVSTSTIAKDYGWSAKRMNKYLHEKGVQYKQGGRIWLLYQKYADKGYTCTKTMPYTGNNGDVHSVVYTYWTQAGRLFIYDLLKENGILPLIERKEA